ncbi:putative MotA/TolQ/ExbB proton channel [Desulfosarcina variabilis str. Montpellier]|uniref:biopolymer transporter ExbB n=1 Tax=Desulfosarcina variabilis TaxID=2300 RepID=UPI003AFAB9D3
MNNPRHHLFWMALYLAIVSVVCLLMFSPLQKAFMANWGFNLLIIAALFTGIAINMRQVFALEPELQWIKMFRTGNVGISVSDPTRLMKPLAKHLEGLNRDHFSLSAFSMRTVLDGIRGRLDESREISRYMIGLLVFLGLLGTFWGLLGTISSVWQVIDGLEVARHDFAAVFANLKTGLQGPLSGMGTAFSSSLFGLGGSLVLGFIDLQAGHAQNRFFNELEEWLSGVTHLIDKAEGQAPIVHAPAASDTAGDLKTQLILMNQELRENNRRIHELLTDRQPVESPKGKRSVTAMRA